MKRYGGVPALAGVDFEVRAGEVHALLGANGAGKSTLVKLLVGAERPDAGRVCLEGQEVRFGSVGEAARHGVAIASQELQMFPDLDVLGNLFVLREPRRGGLISRSEMARRAEPVLREIGLDVAPGTRVRDLTLAEQQLVEIARALLGEPRVLILDEPNSALRARETERLLRVVGTLRQRGIAIVYVSHFLEEVFEIADRITVLRDGRVVVPASPRPALTIPQVVEAMVGPDREPGAPPAPGLRQAGRGGGPGPLRLSGVTLRPNLDGVDLEAAPGEVVGLAGLEGAGVHELLYVIFGGRRPDAGSVTLPGGRPRPGSIEQAVKAGVALIPADRKVRGAMLNRTVYENVAQVKVCTLGRAGFLVRKRPMVASAEEWGRRLRIKMPSVHARLDELSGGNQQKVVFAKWLEADPTVVLLDDPTRGVDVGARGEMHRMVRNLADDGRVVLFTSSDLAELAEVCDRVAVFFGGRVVAGLAGPALTEHGLLEAINTGVPPAA